MAKRSYFWICVFENISAVASVSLLNRFYQANSLFRHSELERCFLAEEVRNSFLQISVILPLPAISSYYHHHLSVSFARDLQFLPPKWLSLFVCHIYKPQSLNNWHLEDKTLQFFLHRFPLLPRTSLVSLYHFCSLLHVKYISIASETLVKCGSCCFSYPSPIFHQSFLVYDITPVPKGDLPESFQTSFYSPWISHQRIWWG